MSNKTWARGKKKLNAKEKQIAYNHQKQRVRIANYVARHPDIDKTCSVCGERPGSIIHNVDDPYYISFICEECNKDNANKTIAIEQRRDIRQEIKSDRIKINRLTDAQIKRYVLDYMNDYISIGAYCKKVNITRYQFNQIVKRYGELFPKQPIFDMVTSHSNAIQMNMVHTEVKRKKAMSIK